MLTYEVNRTVAALAVTLQEQRPQTDNPRQPTFRPRRAATSLIKGTSSRRPVRRIYPFPRKHPCRSTEALKQGRLQASKHASDTTTTAIVRLGVRDGRAYVVVNEALCEAWRRKWHTQRPDSIIMEANPKKELLNAHSISDLGEQPRL